MQGYMPAARRLAQLPEKPQHLADGGAVGFGARGLAGLRQMIPLVQAMGFPQQQAAAPAPAPAPAPVTDPRAAQLQAMIPRMEAMGYKQQPQYLAKGGMVRGPGTGTSDSIPDEVEPGTYIMPADSTQAIGPNALEKMGKMPVRLSAGEYKLPPEQVMAIGEAVLKFMKDATHTPVNGEDGGQTDAEVAEARGFTPGAAERMAEMPEQLFADGGLIENDVTRVGNSYSGGNVGGSITVNGGAPAGTFSENPGGRTASEVAASPAPAPAMAPPAPQTAAAALTAPPAPVAAPAAQPAAPMGWAESNARRNAEVSAASITNRPEWSKTPTKPAAAPPEPPPPAPPPVDSRVSMPPSTFQSKAAYGFQPRRYADGGMVEDDLQKRLAQIPAGGPAGWTGGRTPGGSGGATGSWEAPAPAPIPAPALAPAQPAGALSRAAAMTPQAPAPAVRALSAMPANPTGGEVTSQNMGAAQSLVRRGAADAMAAMPSAPQPVQAPTVLTSENSWQKHNNLRNALVSASSIMNNGGKWDKHKGESPESLTYRAMLATDQGLQASAPGLAQQAMRETGDTQRAGLQVAASSANAAADRMGAMDRTLVTERGNNTRAEIAALGSTEAARIKAAQDNKPPAGYRWAAGGTKLEPIPGGPAGDGKPLTEDQAKSAGYALRMDNALKLIDEVGKTNPGAVRPGLLTAANNALPEGLANQLRTEPRQRVEAAQLDALDAALTLNTGAAYTREQLQGLSRSYFAQPGDDDKTVADKANRLQSLIDTARLRAGEKGAAMTDAAQAKNSERTGGASTAAAPALPSGMARQVGTSGGKPVYEDAQGNRFIGG